MTTEAVTIRSLRRLGSFVVSAVAMISVSACSSSSGSKPASTPSPSSASAGPVIAIHNFKFSPNPLTVKEGSAVVVTNQDGTNHSLSANDASFDTGVFSSGSKTIQLTRPGTFAFHCRIHNFMTGTIYVTS